MEISQSAFHTPAASDLTTAAALMLHAAHFPLRGVSFNCQSVNESPSTWSVMHSISGRTLRSGQDNNRSKSSSPPATLSEALPLDEVQFLVPFSFPSPPRKSDFLSGTGCIILPWECQDSRVGHCSRTKGSKLEADLDPKAGASSWTADNATTMTMTMGKKGNKI
ncbi:uncharacterized protein LOC128252184 [Drosophila gunungcola]|uniref:uncharacterized protein LOC128252184 n=1 Tax=Drosophila gunungcola TaxID=103775 RepID=UPI0022E7B573|nr:uncharacterized protein LOC128252184 [Drosophila gunungcola]